MAAGGPVAPHRALSDAPGRVHDLRCAGDHRLLTGGVKRFAATAGEPLLFVQGSNRTL